jgi:hypothetical protein
MRESGHEAHKAQSLLEKILLAVFISVALILFRGEMNVSVADDLMVTALV